MSGNEITLTVDHLMRRVDGRSSHDIGTNGHVPPPLIRPREGQRVRIHVDNRLDEERSVHWHGLILPFQMDGVPGVSFMANAAAALRREHGGIAFNQVMFDLAEVQVHDGREGYRWEGAAWFGGDIHRVVLNSEGEGDFGSPLGDAEARLLYSPAGCLCQSATWRARIRVRRSYASIGVEALAPYWFDVEGTLFLSDKGELFARGEAYYDQRLTN